MEYIFTFLEGIASFISPCVLPMIPIYLSYFMGEKEENIKKKIRNAIWFFIGFTIVFLLLALFMSSLGKMIGQHIVYFKIVFGIIVILLGLNYMGVFKFAFLNREKSIKLNTKQFNFMKSLLFGMVFSISWTPCVGAFLGSALLFISTQQDLLKGIILILLYAMGLGLPFIISVALMEKLKSTFVWVKKHYTMIVRISGIVLVFMGLYTIFF